MRQYNLRQPLTLKFSIFFLPCHWFFFLIIPISLQRLYILDMLFKGKVHQRCEVSGIMVSGAAFRSMWCLMLNSRKSPEVRAFYRFYGWISCIEYKPVRKVGSTLVSKGQCFETPAFDAVKASKIARSCLGFRWVAVAVAEYWSFKSGYWVTDQVTEYWSFKIRLLYVSNQGRVPGFGSARIVRSVL